MDLLPNVTTPLFSLPTVVADLSSKNGVTEMLVFTSNSPIELDCKYHVGVGQAQYGRDHGPAGKPAHSTALSAAVMQPSMKL